MEEELNQILSRRELANPEELDRGHRFRSSGELLSSVRRLFRRNRLSYPSSDSEEQTVRLGERSARSIRMFKTLFSHRSGLVASLRRRPLCAGQRRQK